MARMASAGASTLPARLIQKRQVSAMKPIYELAVMNVRRLHPKAQDARVSSGDLRFRDSLRTALWNDYTEMSPPSEKPVLTETFDEMWGALKPRFIPDLWWIEVEEKTVHLFEIEDTHPLNGDKLMLLHYFWWDMDALSWDVTLTVFDRYGLAPRPLNLSDFAFHMIPVVQREIRDI